MTRGQTYYNENDPFAAAWLRTLIKAGQIPDGKVDDRDIRDVLPSDLAGFTQCHFFAGIGGWALALRLAGWPTDRPVWTGSCPCQSSSSAARGRNVAKDLWPEWLRLIAECRPCVLFGEQVVRRSWIEGVAVALERVGYRFGAAILPALCVGQDHLRERIYFVGDTNRYGESSVSINVEMARVSRSRGDACNVVRTNGLSERVVAMSGFGNAIVPQVGQVFIQAYLDVCEGVTR